MSGISKLNSSFSVFSVCLSRPFSKYLDLDIKKRKSTISILGKGNVVAVVVTRW